MAPVQRAEPALPRAAQTHSHLRFGRGRTVRHNNFPHRGRAATHSVGNVASRDVPVTYRERPAPFSVTTPTASVSTAVWSSGRRAPSCTETPAPGPEEEPR